MVEQARGGGGEDGGAVQGFSASFRAGQQIESSKRNRFPHGFPLRAIIRIIHGCRSTVDGFFFMLYILYHKIP